MQFCINFGFSIKSRVVGGLPILQLHEILKMHNRQISPEGLDHLQEFWR